MSVAKNKAIIRRYFEEAWGKDNPAIADELLADKLIYIHGETISRADWKRIAAGYYAILGHMDCVIDDMIAEGDKVLVVSTTHAKHIGDWKIPPFGVIRATGKPIVLKVMDIYRLVDGRIVQVWEQADFLGLLQQLGVIKPSA